VSGFRAADVPLMGECARALYSGRDFEALACLKAAGLTKAQARELVLWEMSRPIVRSRRKSHAARYRRRPA
jgi:hypothetical protein